MKLSSITFLAVAGVLLLTRANSVSSESTDIVLGMSTALSGPMGRIGNAMKLGVMAGLERANRAGGLAGQRLRLIALDDRYEAWRTGPNISQLVGKERVLAVIGSVGTQTALAALPIVRDQKVLFFAPYTGSGVLRQNPPERYLINFRASYVEEVEATIDAVVGSGVVAPEEVAFFTQQESLADASFSAGLAALKKNGLRDERSIMHVRYTRNTVAVENALATLLYAERQPRVVIMMGAYASCASFIKLAEASGLKATYVNVSFAGKLLAERLENVAARVVVTQVVPSPEDVAVPVAGEFLSDLAAIDARAEPGYAAFEGYIATRILLRALEQAPVPPTRESLVTALEGLGTFDVGLGLPLTLGAREHQASHRVWPTVIENGQLRPISWDRINDTLEGNQSK